MINKSFNDISIEDFQSLIDNGVSEGKTIEYKQELKILQDNDKKEFLADVSSFANAAGGDLILGIAEDRSTGLPTEIIGLQIDNFDDEFRKIESLIRDSISPRITGVEIRKYDLPYDKSVVIIRIPKSWNAPHQVTYKGTDKFYTRSTNGKYKLDVFELRNAFLLSETITERIRKFRQERLAQVISGETFIPLQQNAKIVLQLVSLPSFQNSVKYNLKDVKNDTIRLRPLGGGNRDWSYNLDGIISYSSAPSQKPYDSYIQIYWNGLIETVNSTILAPYDNKLFIPAVGGLNYETKIVEVVKEYLLYLEELRVDLPILIFLSLVGVKNYQMEAGSQFRFHNNDKKIDRDVLLLPEIKIDSFAVRPEL